MSWLIYSFNIVCWNNEIKFNFILQSTALNKNRRSVSRVLYSAKAECLSFISNLCHHKSLAIYPPTSDEQSYCVGIHDLATHKVYGLRCRHHNRWALTSPFHHYSDKSELFFSVTLLCLYKQLPVRKYGALCCPDFPLFRNKTRQRQTDLLLTYKDSWFLRNVQTE